MFDSRPLVAERKLHEDAGVHTAVFLMTPPPPPQKGHVAEMFHRRSLLSSLQHRGTHMDLYSKHQPSTRRSQKPTPRFA